MSKRLLLLTPPLVQTNAPYPATMHLTGFLRQRGLVVAQRDLSIGTVRDVLIEYGGEQAEELLELLASNAPDEAKLEASRWIDELALSIRDEIDPAFGFSRYSSHLAESVRDFSVLEREIKRRGVLDKPLLRRLDAAIAETAPEIIGVTCPFPGTLVAAFKIARHVRRRYPNIRLLLGGGFVSTELRFMNDRRPYRYFDRFMFDEGYATMAQELSGEAIAPCDVPVFVAPDYDGIEWSDYFDVVETENPMHRLWSVGRWVKLQMARGCYWHRCAFCDVHLPYIENFAMPSAAAIVDAMERTGSRFHFVDEAMPPALIKAVAQEILRRKFSCEWWGNVRFDTSFTPELAKLMAKSGCIAVTGGLECANDRLLALMNKGITLKSAESALKAFHKAGIMVHAYLMYGFPTETEAEALAALEYVRGLFGSDLIQSAFWHRFALTVHSPIAAEPERFGIKITPENSDGKQIKIFCRNEIFYDEPNAPDWQRIGKALELALSNYQEGRGLDLPVEFWLRRRRGRR